MTKEVRMTGYILEDYGNIGVTSTAQEFDTGGATYSVKNNGTSIVYVGSDSNVTVNNGYPLKDGDEIFVRSPIFLIAETTGDVRFIKSDK